MPSSPRPLALVTGATQGIGLAVAQSLAREHAYHVILGVRDASKGEKIATALRGEGHEATVLEVDLSCQSSVEAAIATVERDYGYLDVLVNNAAILLDLRPELGKWELYSNTFTTNVIGTGVLTEGLVPLLEKAKAGPPRIVFVTSTMGSLDMSLNKTVPWYNIDYKSYDASKAAVNMLAINFSRVLDSVNGKVNAVCPGLIKTNLTGFMDGAESPEKGAVRVVEMATVGKNGPTGIFTSRQGIVPW